MSRHDVTLVDKLYSRQEGRFPQMTKLISRISLSLIATLSLVILLLGGFAPSARAQLAPMGIPIPTTVVITRPAPGQIFGDAQTITMGVGAKTYKFGLEDAYVDDPRG